MTNGKRWTAALCLGVAALLGGSRLWADEPKKQQADEVKARMTAEGWKEITEGVYERQLGPTKVEHLGFGREGLSWMVGNLNQRIGRLRQEYERYPSAKLAEIIADLEIESARTRRALWNFDQSKSEGISNVTANVTGPSCSSICYKATADAYPLTNTQGVGAVADSSFSSTCGYSGSTTAYAFARATLNGTTTTVTQTDPHSGTSSTSHAAATVNGGSITGTPCYSEASASVTSTALGIAYDTSDSNSSCPVVNPCTVTISGTNYEYWIMPGGGGCRTRTWTATPSNCSTPVTYQWSKNGTNISGATASTYTQSVCASTASFTLGVSVNGGAATDTHYVEVVVEYCECCSGQICP